MAQIAKMESQVNIKSSPEKLFNAYCNKTAIINKMCPNIVKNVQLLKGDSESIGCIKKWNFAPTGDSSEFVTLATEGYDERNNSVTYNAIDGHLKKMYSIFRFTVKVTNKGNSEGSGSTVKTSLEYVKQNSDVPEPTKYFEFSAALFNGIDTYLVNKA